MVLVNGWFFSMGRYAVFSGCSFTWGQGLWSYCPTDLKVPSVDEYINLGVPVPDVAHYFRCDNRFADLVSNHYHCQSIVKRHNGGTDDENIRFLYEVYNNKVTKHSLLTENVEWENVKFIVYQTTQAYRSPFTFFYKDEEYELFSQPGLQNLDRVQKVIRKGDLQYEDLPNLDIFFDWLIDNNLSVENFEKFHLTHMSQRILDALKYFEFEHNIKTFILCWTNEYPDYFLLDDFAKERLITLQHKEKEFISIESVMNSHPELMILNCPNRIHESGTDAHPSLDCHRMIADSIISKIGNPEF